ncbi:DMT family transporter [Salidesulfovibrio onnuriiensis]|uniref:DMT family transporter n=1 Tax=Salidesulfovibrio onnuriiensis TaxID=2583823 RepID=UPI0011C85154|nr:DMT family transporter [Salidesulfovibrio onnuriiensis]
MSKRGFLHGTVFGVLCALASTMIWSGNFIIARGLNAMTPPVTLAFMRWTVACAAVSLFALPAIRRDWPVLRAHLGYMVVTSLLGVTVFNTLIYVGGRTTVAMNLALISTAFPIFIILLARLFLGEPITLRRVLGVALAVGGITTLVVRGDFMRLVNMTFAVGDMWMLFAAFLFAVYSILIRRKPPELGQTAFLGFTFYCGWLMIIPWMLWEQSSASWPAMNLPVVGSVLYIGLGASLVAYFTWNRAVALIGPSRAGFIYYCLPVFTGTWAWLLLGEPVTLLHAGTGVCILTGIYIATK